MTPLENQNYYEMLDVPYKATWAEIHMAYELAKKTYAEDAMASYSLFDVGEQREILEKIEEAYQVLSDPGRKAKYDQGLREAISPVVNMTPPPSPPVETPVPENVTGEVIKALREEKGISLEEIAEVTRINIDYLAWIETNKFDSLPAEVYVSGYLRQVARMIRCNDKIVDGYMKAYRTWRRQPYKRGPSP